MTRLAAKFLVAAFLTLTTLSGTAGADEGKDGKCTIAVKGDSPTAKACAKGGRAEAKKIMKDMVKQAKAAMAMMPDLGPMKNVVSAMQGMIGSGSGAFTSMQKMMSDMAKMAQSSMPGMKR